MTHFNSRLTYCLILLLLLSAFVILRNYNASSKSSHLSSQNQWTKNNPNDVVVIYNRIPKTASTTLMRLPYELCSILNYHVLMVNITRPQHMFSFPDQMSFVNNVTNWKDKRPAIFHGHFAFLNWDRFGNVPKPIYINMVRKPLDRLVSYYYFLRHGDDFLKNKIRSRHGDKVTFDECVQKKKAECDPKKLWLQIPWFCGHHKQCWEPGSRWALEQAKHNLVNKYFLVGITEEVETFINLLELNLPRFFKGASTFYAESGDWKHVRRTKFKLEPLAETLETMQESKIWKMENEFYEFAATHFNWLKTELGQTKGQSFYTYGKIRP